MLKKSTGLKIVKAYCTIKFQKIQSVFFCIRTEYGDLLRKSPYSVRIQENMEQK